MQEHESLLEAALTESFTPPASRRQSRIAPSGSSLTKSEYTENFPTPAEAAGSAEGGGGEEDTWKDEYEEQVKVWRQQSADAREKAEKERAKWEALRETERAQGVAVTSPPSQETPVLVPHTPSPADSRDLVTGETSKTVSHSRQLTVEDSQKWEHLPSEVTSSLPSMSFPEDTHDDPKPGSSSLPAPTSATLSVFDSSLSTSTRVKAFASALAINLLLPFVNGVMLGFGEIFAKNVVLGWLGWKAGAPGSTAASLGLRKTRR
ncbi:hypothetical protein D9757_008047 [Collybiopsis confluens]|uniref:Uncharacterized protein n=1 Tax=Collybiopsis confluens TaxID=2823264 RepID=A0A8H5M1L7_9AGAR|nr:hypothetical protein D9757_008047 [Collybiopsis confluens]